VATAVAAAGFSLVYLIGQAPGAASPPGGGLAHLGHAGALILNDLGLPWVRALPPLGWLLGLAVLALSASAVVFKGRRGSDWSESAAVSLIVFSLATALMTGAGRSGMISPALVPMRYSIFLTPLHLGLWLLALPYLRCAWTRHARTLQALVGLAAAVMLAHQAAMAVFAVRTADANLRVIADFREGRRYPQMQPIVYGDLRQVLALADWMRRAGFYQAELRPDPPRRALNGLGISASAPGP
jgi:hypothetical protein